MIAEAGDLLKASNMGMAHIAPIECLRSRSRLVAQEVGALSATLFNPRAQNQEAGGDGYAPLGVIIMIDR